VIIASPDRQPRCAHQVHQEHHHVTRAGNGSARSFKLPKRRRPAMWCCNATPGSCRGAGRRADQRIVLNADDGNGKSTYRIESQSVTRSAGRSDRRVLGAIAGVLYSPLRGGRQSDGAPGSAALDAGAPTQLGADALRADALRATRGARHPALRLPQRGRRQPRWPWASSISTVTPDIAEIRSGRATCSRAPRPGQSIAAYYMSTQSKIPRRPPLARKGANAGVAQAMFFWEMPIARRRRAPDSAKALAWYQRAPNWTTPRASDVPWLFCMGSSGSPDELESRHYQMEPSTHSSTRSRFPESWAASRRGPSASP